MNIELTEEALQCFRASTAISGKFLEFYTSHIFVCIVNKGNAYNMLKVSAKRRRSKLEIEQEELKVQNALTKIDAATQAIEDLQKKNQELE
jgi:hypothetical protein